MGVDPRAHGGDAPPGPKRGLDETRSVRDSRGVNDTAHTVSIGQPLPLGATVVAGGVNFSVFSQHATLIELLLFDRFDDPRPIEAIPLHPRLHRTFNYWHVEVAGLGAGQIYAYRAHGPWDVGRGHRFNPRKVLVDPYARGIVYGDNYSRTAACEPVDNCKSAMKSLVVDTSDFDWQDTTPPRVPTHERIIYEMHVRGFTRHPSSGVEHPGTFAGLIERIPWLVELGVTTVQLMPVFQFDEREVDNINPVDGKRLTNYWGYSPIGFFAPHRGYYTEDWSEMRHLTGFRDLVRELHRAGLEVFLDVVFNHTAEGDARGPTLSFRGLDNAVYYLLDQDDRARYADFSGCGNTINANHPMVRRLILDSLRYWVDEMRVDGFRFDLASALSRDEAGRPMREPPLLWEIEQDPTLLHTRLVAEAWDAGGLYQVGDFPGERWAEWNGRFRDDVRRFVRGDHGMAGALAARLLGSADVYEAQGRDPHQSINYVTAHDGFTLADLVAYDRKHNYDNGEENTDGANANWSSNHGAEGPADDPAITALRRRQMKNLLALLFIAHGTPMLLMGDELGRTQRGNNNAYCQDNALSWVDWAMATDNADLVRFVRLLTRLRRGHTNLHPRKYAIGADTRGADRWGRVTVAWHGVRLGEPDWRATARTLAYTLDGPGDVPLHVMVSAHTEALRFAVPPPPEGTAWTVAVDTARPSPEDVAALGLGPVHAERSYLVADRAVVVLEARPV